MGIRFSCPNGHRLNVKAFLAGKRGICPDCGARFTIPVATAAGVESRAPRKTTKNSTPNTVLGSAVVPSIPDARFYDNIPGAEPVADEEHVPVLEGPDSAQPNPSVQRPWPITSAENFVASDQSEWFVQISDGQRFGPAESDTMLEWVRQGRVAPDNLVHQRGWPTWKTAAQVFPELNAMSLDSETSSSPLVLDRQLSPTGKYRGRRAAKSRLFAIVATLGITSVALLAALIYVVRQ